MNVDLRVAAARKRALASSAVMMSRSCAGVRSLHSVITKMRSGSARHAGGIDDERAGQLAERDGRAHRSSPSSDRCLRARSRSGPRGPLPGARRGARRRRRRARTARARAAAMSGRCGPRRRWSCLRRRGSAAPAPSAAGRPRRRPRSRSAGPASPSGRQVPAAARSRSVTHVAVGGAGGVGVVVGVDALDRAWR